jgi:hypothetical protein
MAWVSVVLLAVLSACTTRLVDFVPEEEAVYDVPLEEVWPKVRPFFQEQGFRVHEEPGVFRLETEWREEFGGSRVAGYWHRYMVLGQRDTPTTSKLQIIRISRSANKALRAPGSDLYWGVSSGANEQMGAAQQGMDMPGDLMGPQAGPDLQSNTVSESRQEVRDLMMEWKLHERLAPSLAKKKSSDTPEVVVKQAGARLIECGAPILGLGKVARAGNVVLMGEVHGTHEAPHFLAQSVCQATQLGVPVSVGLEIPANNQERLRRFVASQGTEADWALLMESAFWRNPYPDGRGSEAVVGLLDGLRKLRSQGMDVEVFAFDHPPLEGEAREEAMAKTVLEVAAKSPGRALLVLTGNIHPRLKGLPWNRDYRTLGRRVADTHRAVFALDMAYDSGTAWICAVDEKQQNVDCGVRDAKGKDNGERYFVHLFDGLSPEGYHGIFYVGPVTASLPAVRNGVEPAGEVQTAGQPPRQP